MLLASIQLNDRGATDRLLASVVAQLINEGVLTVGALRTLPEDGRPGQCESDLWLLPDGPVVRITQDLGAGSTACRMDAGALEQAVAIATARLDTEGAHLVVLNKFGLSEAEGRGFRALIAEAIGRNVPVLVGLSDTHRAAFERFADGMATNLPPQEDSILAWCRTTARQCKKKEAQMDGTKTEAPTPALIEHILVRYHQTHRRELPELIALAQKVETDHSNDVNAPHGLTHALQAIVADLEVHMYKEETFVFPALGVVRSSPVEESFAALRDEHTTLEEALSRIAAITHGLRLPSYASGSWIRLYAGLGKLAEDLDEHRYLENEVLFPRFETSR